MNAPPDLVATVEAHGRAVASGDQDAVLADFLPDRVGQLAASAALPPDLTGATLIRIDDVGDSRYDAVIRYHTAHTASVELRSRWLRFGDGSWRVVRVRNIPETPPWVDATGPAGDGLDARHWKALREGRLELQRCTDCATWVWAPRPICPACHSPKMGWQEVDPAGTIYSWTRTWQPFTPESSGHLPYLVVLVELPGADGRRVLGVLTQADGVTPRIGATVRGVIESPPDDAHWPLLRWHLAVAS